MVCSRCLPVAEISVMFIIVVGFSFLLLPLFDSLSVLMIAFGLWLVFTFFMYISGVEEHKHVCNRDEEF
jgi:uncharacterized membrane protein